MRKILMLFVVVAVCGCVAWFVQTQRSEARTELSSSTVISDKSSVEAVETTDEIKFINTDLSENIADTLFLNIKFLPQQVGVTCKAYPRCPDCGGGGNVCRGAEEFYGGITGVVGKRMIIAKCKQANALDYCGGSRGCVKKTRQEQNRHREQNGGGCYKQCEKVAGCYLDNR